MNKTLFILLALVLMSGCYTELYVVDSTIIEAPPPPPPLPPSPPPPQPEPDPCWNCYQPAPSYDPSPTLTQPALPRRDSGSQRIEDRRDNSSEKNRQNSPPRNEHHR